MNLLLIEELPIKLRERAARAVRDIEASPVIYPAYHGKRLQGDREILSVPLAMHYRLLFIERDGNFLFCGGATHETYNRICRHTSSQQLAPMKRDLIDLSPFLNEPAATPAPECPPAPAPSSRGGNRNSIRPTLSQWLAAAAPGEQITARDLAVLSGGTANGAAHLLADAGARGELVKVGIGLWQTPLVKVAASDLPASNVVEMRQPPAIEPKADTPIESLDAYIVRIRELFDERPPLDITTVSDDDLMLEVHRRMIARKAAA